MSFTNAAINEARNRLKDVKGGRLVECYTIDSFAGRLNQLVRENTGLKFQTNTYEENMIAAAKFVKGEADKDSRKCVQGFIDRTIDLLIIDEAAFIKNIDEIWGASQQTLATGGKCNALSTPNGMGNWFHKTWSAAETGENNIRQFLLQI